ncbi:hypothetical protein [Nocardioides terrigena]|uniref:hypothetical protein n=1 Tax=Nocardioides terrigena TaxID=424797 RepID=UPI002D775344|nr:hypothetical protein [Nocardioides terrigena]
MERWKPSKAISTTCSGRTCTTKALRSVGEVASILSVCQANISSVIPLNVFAATNY